MKKFLSILLSLTLLFQAFPVSMLAESGWSSADSPTIRGSGTREATYTVTWFSWDENGESNGSYTAAAGTLLSDILPSHPVKASDETHDYRFSHWKDNSDGNTIDPSTKEVEGDISVTAVFDVIEYCLVTFKVDDNESTTEKVEKGTPIGSQMPNDPEKTGSRFDGWFDGDTEVTAQTIVSESMTVTAKFIDLITVTFNPNTEEGGELANIEVQVGKGKAIGSLLPTVPDVPGYNTKWVTGETEVTAETVVTEPFTAVVGKDKIIYTVTFVQEDGTEETRTADIDGGFAVNELPEVAPKSNKVGKWVYSGTTNEFTVGTVISGDLTVNAYYEQNIFTVTFMVDNAQYEEMTTSTGTTIVLPSEPIKEGATFSGWFTEPDGEGIQYTASSTVNEDLTLYAYFADQVRVKFLVKDDNGNIISEKSQYFIDLTVGDQITTLPDDPFIEGKVFDHWEHETTDGTQGEIVAVGTVVTESFNAVAVFSSIDTYELTVKYYYINGRGDRIDIGTQVYQLVEGDFDYTVTAPEIGRAHV